MRKGKTTSSFLLCLLATGLGGCLMTTQDVMNSWLGTTDVHLMAIWGAPDLESTAGGGFRVLTYKEEKEDAYDQRYVCRSTFTVDAGHRIVAATYHCG
jgi:hypothetical protein